MKFASDGFLNGIDFDLSVQDVRKIIGVDAGAFQMWLARDILPFETVKSGKRTFRRFKIQGIPRIILIATIWKNGVDISESVEIADFLLKKLADLKKGEELPYGIAYFRDAATAYYLYRSGTNLYEAMDETGICSAIVISIKHLEDEIRQALTAAKKAHEAMSG